VKRFSKVALPIYALIFAVAVGSALASMSELFDPIFGKLTLSDSASVFARLGRWESGAMLFFDKPIVGLGAGGFLTSDKIGDGIISWWLQLIVEGGVFAALLMFAFFAVSFIIIVRLKSRTKYALMTSIVAVGVHYIVISDYWLPWLWFLVNLVLLASLDEKTEPNAAVYCAANVDR